MLNSVEITDITKTKKGYNALFSEGEFLFSVDDMLLAQQKIKIGSCFSQQELTFILEKSETSRAVQKAYNLLSFRPHSQKELSDKLTKTFDRETSQKAVEKMVELGLVNDEEYCTAKAEYLINVKKTSLAHTRLKLLSLGIDKDIIEDCLQFYDRQTQEESLDRLLQTKYQSKLSNPDKVIQSLMRKGFGYSEIKAALNRLEIETEEDF
ncbi:MAG: RecX family transcriptional regulator [Oscillospiraceae bacterium]